MIVDLFAGPGGWDEGLRMLGRTDVLGIEWEPNACATAEAAGHRRLQADVAALNPADYPCIGLIASPPCQAWSMAGKRLGEHDRTRCHVLADRMAAGDDSLDFAAWADERSPLVCQPVRWVRELRPEWVTLEEVPAVAGLWEHLARIFRGWGYSVWTGDLCAADYGVPQTRTRRILMAHLNRKASPPPPTHAESAHGADMFGGHTLPWVTMAEALGWGFDEPSATVSGGGTGAGGAEPFANASYRRRLAAMATNQGNPRDGCYERAVDQPAPTLTSQLRSFQWISERPATTVVGSFRPDVIAAPGHRTTTSRQDAAGSIRVTVQEAAVLQSFPADYPWQGSKTRQYEQVGNAVPPLLAAHVLQALGVGTLTTEAAA